MYIVVSGLDGKSVECDKHQSNEAIKLRKTKFNRKKEDKVNIIIANAAFSVVRD